MGKFKWNETTIGVLLADPQAKACFEKHTPALLAHPLLEAGKAFTMPDALPFVAGTVSDEQVAALKAAIEAL